MKLTHAWHLDDIMPDDDKNATLALLLVALTPFTSMEAINTLYAFILVLAVLTVGAQAYRYKDDYDYRTMSTQR